MLEVIRRYAPHVKRFLEARSPEEHEMRVAHGLALLFVLTAALTARVTGLTLDRAPFTLLALAVAAAAARGGPAPAVLATLASILVARALAPAPLDLRVHLAFALEALGVALVVCLVRARLFETRGRLAAAQARIVDLKRRDRHGRLVGAMLGHLEDAMPDAAVVLLDERGAIVGWREGAARLYGYSEEEAAGESASSLFLDPPDPREFSLLLRDAIQAGPVHRASAHRRRDGGRLDVEFDLRPVRIADAPGFTLTVRDLARNLEWDDYREAARLAQAALQEAANDTRQQLAALESLTDPELNPFDGAGVVEELLERLRTAVRADGAALAHPADAGLRLVAKRGLQPAVGPAGGVQDGAEPSVTMWRGPLGPRSAPGRVAIVHNDAARVRQLSALGWSADVTSLLAVPVVHDGTMCGTIEVVSQRSRQVSDWDVALVRIVADRLAAVVARARIPHPA